jgi:hypothetical protein
VSPKDCARDVYEIVPIREEVPDERALSDVQALLERLTRSANELANDHDATSGFGSPYMLHELQVVQLCIHTMAQIHCLANVEGFEALAKAPPKDVDAGAVREAFDVRFWRAPLFKGIGSCQLS